MVAHIFNKPPTSPERGSNQIIPRKFWLLKSVVFPEEQYFERFHMYRCEISGYTHRRRAFDLLEAGRRMFPVTPQSAVIQRDFGRFNLSAILQLFARLFL